MNDNQTQLDPQAVNLTKAIRQTESGGNFQAQGKSGEYGAYQFTEPTWDTYAKDAGVNVALKDATPEQQNQVAYAKIKQWKDAGNNIGQIASMWNAGEKNKDAYLNGNSGTNKYGVHYDTGAYAKSVATAYQTLKGGGQVQADPNNPSSVQSSQNPGRLSFSDALKQAGVQTQAQSSSQDDSLSSELTGRANDVGTAVSDTLSGKINPIHGIANAAGAIAGGIGDVVNKGIELIPGVKAGEDWLSQTLGKAVNTPTGQSVVKSIQSFSQAHPELSDYIKDGFNIVTALPILDGVGSIGASVVGKALEGSVVKGVSEDIIKSVGRDFAENGGEDTVKSMVQNRVLPTVEKGVYNTDAAMQKLDSLVDSGVIDAKSGEADSIKSMLDSIDGKPHTQGTIMKAAHSGLKAAGTFAGEQLGNMTGHPLAGAGLGYLGGAGAEKLAQGASERVVNSSLKGIGKDTLKTLAKKSVRGITGALLQKANH